jgi:hypothetical protein
MPGSPPWRQEQPEELAAFWQMRFSNHCISGLPQTALDVPETADQTEAHPGKHIRIEELRSNHVPRKIKRANLGCQIGAGLLEMGQIAYDPYGAARIMGLLLARAATLKLLCFPLIINMVPLFSPPYNILTANTESNAFSMNPNDFRQHLWPDPHNPRPEQVKPMAPRGRRAPNQGQWPRLAGQLRRAKVAWERGIIQGCGLSLTRIAPRGAKNPDLPKVGTPG